MSKKSECYLCGARLQNGYCHDCGLDNTRIHRKTYHLNESKAISNINGKAISKRKESLVPKKVVQIEDQSIINQPIKSNPTSKYQFVNSGNKNITVVTNSKSLKKRGKTKKRIRGKAIIGVIIVMVILIQFLVNLYDEFSYGESYMVSEPEYYTDYEEVTGYEPYEFVTRELSETGENFEVTLEPGEYIVGTHLPEGNYTVNIAIGSGTFHVNDDENGIYLWGSFDENDEYGDVLMEDVRLYQNARVSISEDVMLTFYTENAQISEMSYIQNPLTEEIYVESDTTLTAGTDFPSGVYDALCVEEYAAGRYTIPVDPDEYEEGYVGYSFWADLYGVSDFYRNIVLPEGAQITAEDYDFILIPSEIISSTDYNQYYDF